MKQRFVSPISLDILVLLGSLCLTFVLWRIASTFPPNQIPLYVFTVGIFASFFLFCIVFGLSRAEKKATEADAEHWRFISAIESMPLGLAMTDITGEVILSNYQLSKILGEPTGQWTLKELDKRLKGAFSVTHSQASILENRQSLSWEKITVGNKEIKIYMAPVFSEMKGLLGILILLQEE